MPTTAFSPTLLERRQHVLGAPYKLFYQHPVHFERSEGVWLYDEKGQAYLDAYNNVPVVGHCHPHVVKAITEQAGKLNTHTRYMYDVIVDYAEHLLSKFKSPLSRVVFSCSGSESNDLALRMARFLTGGEGVIVTEHAYHGITTAISEVSPSFGQGSPLGQGVRTVPAPVAAPGEDADCVGQRFAQAVKAAVKDLERHGIKPAALLVDTIFSSDGIYAEPAGFLAQAQQVIHAAGGFFIADEVQAGFARLGTHMWGFERHGLSPDMVVMGKPMGNGMPISAVVASAEVFERFAARTRYFNTFGGNPVSCAAAKAVLEVIEEEDLQANALEVGQYLVKELQNLTSRYQVLGDIRGAGLFVGVDVIDPASAKADAALAADIVNRLRDKRVLISASGALDNVLKIRPPLPFNRQHADLLLNVLDEVLADVHTGKS